MKRRVSMLPASAGAAAAASQAATSAETPTQSGTTAGVLPAGRRSRLAPPLPLDELLSRIKLSKAAASRTAAQPAAIDARAGAISAPANVSFSQPAGQADEQAASAARHDLQAPQPTGAPDEPGELQPGSAMSETFKSVDLRSNMFGFLVQSQSTAGDDILPRARELARIQTTSATFKAYAAAFMGAPAMAETKRVFAQTSVQRSITQLAGNPAQDGAAFGAALEVLLRDKQDVGVDLEAICRGQPLSTRGSKGAIVLKVLAAKNDLQSLAVKHADKNQVDVGHVFLALAAIHANNPALESLPLDLPLVPNSFLGTFGPVHSLDQLDSLSSLTKLTHLNLDDHQAGGSLVRALAPLASLTSLNVGNNCLSGEAIARLAALTNLTSLDLSSNTFDRQGFSAALGGLAGALTKLTSLNVGFAGYGMTRRDSQLAPAVAGFVNLRNLELGGAVLEQEDMRSLAALTNLTSLDLTLCQLSPGCLTELAALPVLKALNLRHTDIGDAQAAALMDLPALTTLDIGGLPLSEPMCDALQAMPNMRRLIM